MIKNIRDNQQFLRSIDRVMFVQSIFFMLASSSDGCAESAPAAHNNRGSSSPYCGKVGERPDAGAGLGDDRCERGLADLKRITPQVVAIQLDQVEGVEEGAVVMAVVANEIERGNAVIIAGDSFTVDNTGARAQADAAESDG